MPSLFQHRMTRFSFHWARRQVLTSDLGLEHTTHNRVGPDCYTTPLAKQNLCLPVEGEHFCIGDSETILLTKNGLHQINQKDLHWGVVKYRGRKQYFTVWK